MVGDMNANDRNIFCFLTVGWKQHYRNRVEATTKLALEGEGWVPPVRHRRGDTEQGLGNKSYFVW